VSQPTNFGAYTVELYGLAATGHAMPFSSDLTLLEETARDRMAAGAFAYVAGGGGSGSTLRANLAAFDRWRIVPRMLTGATTRDLRTTVLGADLPAPVLLAPVGTQTVMHPDGELATARAAAALGLPMILSTVSSYPLEQVADANADGERWFQLYWPDDPEVCASILSRAKAAGYRVLVLTLDTWTVGWRPASLDHASLPFVNGTGAATAFTDPVFLSRLDRTPEDDRLTAVARWAAMFMGTDHTWADLAFLRDNWDGPIVLKGIQHPDDARRAVDAGAAGIIVSNHGGRQLDGAVGSLEMLPSIAAAVADQTEILFDSGIRTGADIVKALALGARAVLVGRPFAYGLALAGEPGIGHALRCLLADLHLTLGLSGHRTPAELTPDILHRI
jgi:lactate 2-monooxygenase